MRARFKELIPAKLKQAAKAALSKHQFAHALSRIANLSLGEMPSRTMLLDLSAGWGNEGYAANIDYVEAVAKRAVATPGPILECGTGLTTILVGLLAGRRGIETWSLEHSQEWQEQVLAALKRHRVPKVRVCFSPLRAYAGFSWYDAPLDSMPAEFKFVICDGPPSATPGGRYGLLAILGKRLPIGVQILLDDADRSGELEVLDRWKVEAKVNVALHKMPAGTFALVTRE